MKGEKFMVFILSGNNQFRNTVVKLFIAESSTKGETQVSHAHNLDTPIITQPSHKLRPFIHVDFNE